MSSCRRCGAEVPRVWWNDIYHWGQQRNETLNLCDACQRLFTMKVLRFVNEYRDAGAEAKA